MPSSGKTWYQCQLRGKSAGKHDVNTGKKETNKKKTITTTRYNRQQALRKNSKLKLLLILVLFIQCSCKVSTKLNYHFFPQDVLSYRAVGISVSRIFTINHRVSLVRVSVTPRIYCCRVTSEPEEVEMYTVLPKATETKAYSKQT